ncbi:MULTISPECIES: hypothetical protein [Myroides]|uniref:hypothetical protein n=1 Tax=Myroides TaxID=76831 RepID=UPI001CE0DD99|nr:MULTISPECIES: hypothetical protein [Myroides]MCA4794320.1 hypothetical protein [Myroides odoratimimus]MCA4821581.1 hypothetical protein [Myroides odoratimimus]MDM1067197.1 hypothetical protein [Myroides odoratimimus]MDM1346024.1 hypothetical protein [Myroides marinus]
MKLIDKQVSNYRDFSSSACDVNCIHVQIKNLKSIVDEIHSSISDTSWIDKLDALSQEIFRATSFRTIDKVVNEIIAGVTSNINEDIGEYIVSYVGQNVLETKFSHTKIPLAELLKEKVSGNPGFDFHTISTKRFLVFGEAKFSIDGTPRAIALNQIGEFITLKKEIAELQTFRPFMDEECEKNVLAGMRGYAAAFSFNAKEIDTIFKNALESEIIDELIKHKELYLIAVEIC